MINFARISNFLLFSFVLLSIAFCFPISLFAVSQGDSYEPDNSYAEPQFLGDIGAGNSVTQDHTFHKFFDEDWIQFDAIKGHTYSINAGAKDSNVLCDTIIELYASDGTALLKRVNNHGAGVNEFLEWTSPEDASFFIRFINDSIYYGSSVTYVIDFLVSEFDPLPGYLNGRVTSKGVGIRGVILEANNGAGVSLADGTYIIGLPEGTATISVHKDGYHSQSFPVTILANQTIHHNVELVTDLNRPPTITGTPENDIIVNRLYSFRPIATDPESDSLFFSIANKPSWLSFNPENGMILGVPNANNVGMYGPITITVQDSRGASSHMTPFMIEVQDVLFSPGILILLMK
jgi:hypothetical protein